MTRTSKQYRAEVLSRVSADADRIMNDRSLDRLRSLPVRRALSAMLVLVAATTMFSFAAPGAWALVHLVALGGLWFLLRRVSRGFVDFPDEFVDERIRASRNESYRLAYMTVAAGVVVVWIGLDIIEKFAGPDMFGGMTRFHVMQSLFWTVLVLPNAVFAWREPEL